MFCFTSTLLSSSVSHLPRRNPVRSCQTRVRTPAVPSALELTNLVNGVVVGRPNRFIFDTLVDSEVVEAHSPAVGKISGSNGLLTFGEKRPIRALLSCATGPTAKNRRTQYTVEALDIGDDTSPSFCGINQSKSNAYLAHFLKQGAIPSVLPPGSELRREVKSPDGRSRIDFVGTSPDGRTIWIENKTMLWSLPISEKNPAYEQMIDNSGSMPPPDRMLKHWSSLRDCAARENTEAVVVLTYLTNASKFQPPRAGPRHGTAKQRALKEVMNAATSTADAGVRFIQVNLPLTVSTAERSGPTAKIVLGDIYDLDIQ